MKKLIFVAAILSLALLTSAILGQPFAFGGLSLPLSINISPSIVTLYVGQSWTFNASATGGTPPYSYFWGNGTSLVSAVVNAARSSPTTSPTGIFTPSSPSVWYVACDVKDSVGNTAGTYSTVYAVPFDWWTMFHHDLNRTGYSTSTAPTTNQTLWNYTTGNSVCSSPAVANGIVYVGSVDGNVYALNAATGAWIWNYTTGGSLGFSSPAVANGIVYVGSYDDNVYALNATTGAWIWNYTTGFWVPSSPAVANGIVYVGSMDGKVYALNAMTGALIWNYTTGSIVWSSPAVANGIVYVGSYDDNVYALNAATGAWIWNYTTGNAVDSSPAVANGIVYVGSMDGNVYAMNAATGKWIWNYTTGGPVESSPAVAYGIVYVGSDDNNTYALNAMTGTQVWNYTTGNSVYSSPAVANGTVYVGSEDDKLYCLDAYTGASVWNYTTGGWVDSSPAVANGIVYVGSDDWNVYAFSTPTDWWTMFHHDLNRTGYSTSTAPTTNQTLWNYATFGSVFSSPAVANGTVYVGSEDDNVTALNAATGAYIWSYNTTSPVESSPAVANGIVYVGSDGDNVTALNAATGAYIWSYTTGAPVESSPAVANGMVYVGSNDTHVYALNAATGTQVWNYTTGGPVESSPAVSGGIVYVGSDDDNVTALDETTGAYIWSYNTTSPIGYSSPAVANGTVYVCSTSGGVFALNASALPMSPTTRCIWNVYHGASPWLDSPAVFGGVVYASGDGYTYALNATNSGSLIWLYKTGDSAGTGPTGGPGPISSCAVADGVVYIGGYVTTVVKGSPTNLGEIYALNATVPPGQTIPYTPVCLWNYTTGPPQVNSSPAVANGTVYVGSDDNNTYAFGAHLISITGPWPIPPPILKTVVGLGYSVGMAVTAADLGSYTETFNVALFANTTILASQNVMLPSGASTTLAFTWNTTGFAYGNYTLSAYASPVPGQTNTTNNSLTVGNVFVTIPGDVNGDGTVNILDAILLANAFTATPGSSNWNPNADINCDGVVNILDAIILANNFTASIP